jgi:hypothetical protein
MRSWVACVRDTHYILGSAVGPHPFPLIVREFQRVIGREAREQFRALNSGALPDAVVACVGGGSNAIGMFYDFIPDASVRLLGVEAAGKGIESGQHCSPFAWLAGRSPRFAIVPDAGQSRTSDGNTLHQCWFRYVAFYFVCACLNGRLALQTTRGSAPSIHISRPAEGQSTRTRPTLRQ